MEQMRWTGYVAHMDWTRNVQILFPENLKGRAFIGRSVYRGGHFLFMGPPPLLFLFPEDRRILFTWNFCINLYAVPQSGKLPL
jgi:hypothetical protein